MGLVDTNYNSRVVIADQDVRDAVNRLSEYKQLRRKRYVDDVDRQLKEQQPMSPITLPKLHFMRDLGDTFMALDRLLEHKQRAKEQKIVTLERNGPKLESIISKLMAKEYPGVVGFTYVQ